MRNYLIQSQLKMKKLHFSLKKNLSGRGRQTDFEISLIFLKNPIFNVYCGHSYECEEL